MARSIFFSTAVNLTGFTLSRSKNKRQLLLCCIALFLLAGLRKTNVLLREASVFLVRLLSLVALLGTLDLWLLVVHVIVRLSVANQRSGWYSIFSKKSTGDRWVSNQETVLVSTSVPPLLRHLPAPVRQES